MRQTLALLKVKGQTQADMFILISEQYRYRKQNVTNPSIPFIFLSVLNGKGTQSRPFDSFAI